MQTLNQQLDESKYKGLNRYLGLNDFGMMLFTAFCLHVLAVAVYDLLPKTSSTSVPVRTISVKFGDDTSAPAPAVAPPMQAEVVEAGSAAAAALPMPTAAADPNYDSKEVMASLDDLLKDLQTDEPDAPQAAKPRVKPAVNPARAKPQKTEIKYVRAAAPAPTKTKGNALGNKAQATEVIRRYEQVISLWIGRNRIYPAEARKKGLQGEAVVRVRVNRAGKIVQYWVERSSGHTLIDAALGEMVRRSDPVPAVPSSYPGGNLIDFLIPVDFYLSKN